MLMKGSEDCGGSSTGNMGLLEGCVPRSDLYQKHNSHGTVGAFMGLVAFIDNLGNFGGRVVLHEV